MFLCVCVCERERVFDTPLLALAATSSNQRFGWFYVLLCMYETCELTIWIPPFVMHHEVEVLKNGVHRLKSSDMLVRMRRPELQYFFGPPGSA